MTDPIEKQRPLLVWGTDHEEVLKAWRLCRRLPVECCNVIEGPHYSLFCAYLDAAIPPDLDTQLRALVSHVQVSLSRK